MKSLPLALLLLCVTAFAAEKQDITLTDGRTFKAARIASIGDEVSIVYAAGVVSVPADLVPLDVLARAHMELTAKDAERKKNAAEIAKKAEAQSAAAKAKRDEDVRAMVAMSNVRAQAQGDTAGAMPTRITAKQTTETDAAIASLNAAMPRHPNGSSQDPMVRDCVSKYVRAFGQIHHDTIAQNAKWIRDQITKDTASFQQTIATTKPSTRSSKTATSTMRASSEDNLKWVNALASHLDKYEALPH